MPIENHTLTDNAACFVFGAELARLEIREGNYLVRLARSSAELDVVLRLRFAVFNLELGEGLDESLQTGRDQDEFDEVCHHLIVVETTRNEIVGTYRLQTGEMAAAGRGFYSAGEFDLSHLPPEVCTAAVELGRACIARAHRKTQVLFLLWRGIIAYMQQHSKRYLFGCCSLTSQDGREGQAVLQFLEQNGHMHPNFFVPPRAEVACPLPAADDEQQEQARQGFIASRAPVPRLFRIYLSYGTKACGPPAIDRHFKTIDYFVVLDIETLDERTRRFFAPRQK